jgi:hypothetical protein
MTASDTSVLEYRMIRAEFTVAAIVLGITVAVALLDAIKECSTSAQAQTQTASPNNRIG